MFAIWLQAVADLMHMGLHICVYLWNGSMESNKTLYIELIGVYQTAIRVSRINIAY